MSTGTRIFLLLGCLVVVVLEAPASLASLSAGWRGPYSRPVLASVPPPAAVPVALLAAHLALPVPAATQVARR